MRQVQAVHKATQSGVWFGSTDAPPAHERSALCLSGVLVCVARCLRASVNRNACNGHVNSRLDGVRKRNRLTAASSGGNAPFAILWRPGLRTRLFTLFDPSDVAAKSFAHSSSVATCPSWSEKNLWRRTVLMRSSWCVVYQPSRSWQRCQNRVANRCA